MSERFQKLWPKSLWEDYIDRIEEIASRASSILAVSKESGKGFLNLYPEIAHKIQAIPHASDYSLFWPYVQGDHLSQPPYVLYVGGFDPRKEYGQCSASFCPFFAEDK